MSDSWQTVPTRSVARIEIGGTPAREEPRFWADQDNGHPWASIADLSSQEVVETAEYISDLGVRLSNVKLVPAGTPIMSFKLTIGRTALAGRDLYTNEAIAAFFFDPARVDGRFLFHILPGSACAVITDVAIKGATLNKKSLAAMPLLLPPIAEQRRIAKILDTLDAQISLVRRTVEKLKLAREGLLRDLLSRGVNSNGCLRDPRLDHGEFKNTVLGLLPCEWRVATCGELSREIVVGIVIRPTQYYRSAGIPVLRSANVRESGLDTNDVVYMSPVDHVAMSKSAVKPGDLVTVRTGYPGTTAVIPDSLPSANCVDIIITRPGSEVRSDYLALWVNSDLGKGQVLRAQGGLAQQHFNVSEMKALLVAVPPLPEQAVIAARAAAADQRLVNETRELMKLTTLKRGLVADLLTGRVRVSSEVAT